MYTYQKTKQITPQILIPGKQHLFCNNLHRGKKEIFDIVGAKFELLLLLY